MKTKTWKGVVLSGIALLGMTQAAATQKEAWRQATEAELASVLPSRAPVVGEHIETEMRTASGIVDGHGRFIAGVVLITAGYSAEGKYSHYLLVQAPIQIGGVPLKRRRSADCSFQCRGDRRPGGNHRCTLDCGLVACGKPAHLAAGGESDHPNRTVRRSI